MTLTLTNVLGGIAPKLEVLNQTQSIVSMLIIPFFAWFNFNTWAGNDVEATHSNPPRHFTTFSRYVWYAFIYTMIIEFVYILFLITPGLFHVVSTQFNANANVDPATAEFKEDFPLWLLVFLISIVPNTPGLRKVERWVRTQLHQQAFIPAEADALVNQFIMHPARFESEPASMALVLETIAKDIPATHDVARPDKRLRHRWFKMSYLYRKINEWKANREIMQYYSFCGPTLKSCEEEYRDLQLDVRSYYTSMQQLGKDATEVEKNYLDAKKRDIDKRLNILLNKAYQLICCGILATQKTHQGRMDAFRFFGLTPDFTEGPQVYVDIVLGCVFLTTFLTFVTTYVFHLINPDVIRSMATVVSWTVVMILLQGTSILVAVILYRRLSMKERLGARRGNGIFVFGPLTDISIGSMAGYLTGFVIIVTYAVQFSPKDSWSLLTLVNRLWPWPLIPATTSGFVIYYLYSLNVERKRLAEGAIQALTMSVVAAFVYIISMELRAAEINLFFLLYCAVVCGLTGFAIGWTFPEEYRRRKKATIKSYDRRTQSRISLYSAGILQVGDEQYPCQTEDLSLEGAKLTTVIPEEVGTNVFLNLNDVGAIQGVISRKGEKQTCLKFFPDEQTIKRLAAYIGLYEVSPEYD